jgi:two-component system, chemotaxis family, sensor kinase CheA
MSIDVDMAEIAALFIEECGEGLEIMESGLMNLDLGAADPDTMNSIFRAAHSIKGGGATFGFLEISEFAHHVETLLDEMRKGQRDVTREAVDLLLLSVDCISAMVSGLDDGGPIDTVDADQLVVKLQAMLEDKSSATAPVENAADEAMDPVASEEVDALV